MAPDDAPDRKQTLSYQPARYSNHKKGLALSRRGYGYVRNRSLALIKDRNAGEFQFLLLTDQCHAKRRAAPNHFSRTLLICFFLIGLVR